MKKSTRVILIVTAALSLGGLATASEAAVFHHRSAMERTRYERDQAHWRAHNRATVHHKWVQVKHVFHR